MLPKVITHSQFRDNPAHFWPELQSIFLPGVITAVMQEPGDPALLFPEEAAYLGRAVPKRAREFAAGRLCARRALDAVGIANFPLRVADDRQPVWPASVVGSISHTAGLCVAAVALLSEFYAIGVDCEVVGHVGADLWPTILTPSEHVWLRSLPEAQQPSGASLIFSAKEAFYKCQYPVTREWLDFEDLIVDPLEWGGSSGEFSIRETRLLGRLAAPLVRPTLGRYLFHSEFVTTGVSWTRG